MSRIFTKSAFGVTAVMMAFLITIAIGLNAGESTKTLRIIYSNDTQGEVEPCG